MSLKTDVTHLHIPLSLALAFIDITVTVQYSAYCNTCVWHWQMNHISQQNSPSKAIPSTAKKHVWNSMTAVICCWESCRKTVHSTANFYTHTHTIYSAQWSVNTLLLNKYKANIIAILTHISSIFFSLEQCLHHHLIITFLSFILKSTS